jgi:hypothetical protein
VWRLAGGFLLPNANPVCGPISTIIAYLLTAKYGYLNEKMTIPLAARSEGRFIHTMPFSCHDPATALPFSDSDVSFLEVPDLVHEFLLLSPSIIFVL